MLGARADKALERPFADLWDEVRSELQPYFDAALAGRGTWVEDLPLRLTRNGYLEVTF